MNFDADAIKVWCHGQIDWWISVMIHLIWLTPKCTQISRFHEQTSRDCNRLCPRRTYRPMNFNTHLIYVLFDGHTERSILMPVLSMMHVKDRPTNKIRRPLHLLVLWQTDQLMKFNAPSINNECDRQTYRWILTPVQYTSPLIDRWTNEIQRQFNQEIRHPFYWQCMWQTDLPIIFDASSIYKSFNGQTDRWISTPVWSMMPVTDRPTYEFSLPLDLRVLWWKGRLMNFNARSIYDACDGQTDRRNLTLAALTSPMKDRPNDEI
jgi:hypothetical protein